MALGFQHRLSWSGLLLVGVLVGCGDDSSSGDPPDTDAALDEGDAGSDMDSGTGEDTMDAGADSGMDAAEPDAAEPDDDAGEELDPDLVEMGIKRPPRDVSEMQPDEVSSMSASTAASGNLATDTEQSGDDGDDQWVLEIDIDGDGDEEEVTVLYDDEAGAQYVWWEGVLEEFCLNGDDADALFMTVHYTDGSKDVLLWQSDCDEDEDLVYGCSGENSEEYDVCGTCALDDRWICAADGGFDTNYTCECDAACDDLEYVVEVDLCELPEDEETAMSLAVEQCELEFAQDNCGELSCDCSCEEESDLSCE